MPHREIRLDSGRAEAGGGALGVNRKATGLFHVEHRGGAVAGLEQLVRLFHVEHRLWCEEGWPDASGTWWQKARDEAR